MNSDQVSFFCRRAQIAVRRLDFFQFTQTLAIRRVADDNAVFGIELHILHRHVLDRDRIFQVGCPYVVVRQGKHFRIDVRPDDLQRTGRICARSSASSIALSHNSLRDSSANSSREITNKPWCDVAPDQRCFDADRTRTAERIEERTIRRPTAEIDHRRSQCFFERCLCGQFTIPAFVQTSTRGVEGQ